MNYLLEAFRQSIYAIGNSDPNPPVGAVLVDKNGKLIGSGYTQPFGSHHAEIMAINDARQNYGAKAIIGSTLYVTLEPCSHYGKTPPCTLAIVESKISKVVIACQDLSGKVQGIQHLRDAAIIVEVIDRNLFDENLLWTIDAFHFSLRNKRPRIFLKWAQTQNGWLAPLYGASGSISGKDAKEIVFRMRKMLHGVLVTPGTVFCDRPLLNPRYEGFSVKGLQDKNYLNDILLSFEHEYPEKFRKLSKRFIMLPSFSENWHMEDLQKYMETQEALSGEFYLITSDPEVRDKLEPCGKSIFFMNNYDEMELLFRFAFEKGAINLMIEAGPVYAEKIWNKGFADFLISFKNNKNHWIDGRGFQPGYELAKYNEQYFTDSGYRKLYEARLTEDELRIYQKI